ncbi:MAG: FtsX-like permease family protein [bacterium]|nr:FtsX-like permease family protein [bacterium]
MKENKQKPPRLAKWLFSRMSRYNERYSITHEVDKVFYSILSKNGYFKAALWYWYQAIISYSRYTSLSIYRNTAMIKNYIKIAFRNIRRHKAFSVINISGLAIGIACCILIMMYVSFELSFDKFHEKSDRTYRIGVHGQIIDVEINQVHTPAQLKETLLSEYPEVEQAIRIHNLNGRMINVGEQSFQDNRIIASDPEFFQIFSFPFITGDPKTALSQTNTAVITQSAAYRYFGTEDPVNKILNITDIDFRVTGIIEDVPENSHLQFNVLLSGDSFPDDSRPWNNNMYATYLILPIDYDHDLVDQKLIETVNRYVLPVNRHFKSWEYYLEPLEDIHLRSKLRWGNNPGGDIVYVYVFSSIAFFILLIACVNFMILSTAKSTIRAKEIGVRKVIGSSRVMLIRQFMSESFLLSFIAMLIAVILVECSLPAFRALIGRNIELHYFNNYYVIPGLIIIALFVSFFSGSYPAFYLSSLKAVNVLKGGFYRRNKKDLFRNGLVIFQFSVTVILIASSLILFSQLKYFQNKKLGFSKEQVIIIDNSKRLGGNFNSFKEAIKQNSNVLSISGSSSIPGRGIANIQITPENSNRIHFDFLWCDYDYLKTMEIELVEGRFFSPEYGSDENAIVINEEVADQLGWSDPVGKELTFGRRKIQVIGVIKNFHYMSLHRRIDKLGILLTGSNIRRERYISIRLRTDELNETLQSLKDTWDSFSPPIPLDYSFLDEDFDSLYRSEQQTGQIALIFTLLAVFISCIGLFGLAAYLSERRTKEIGIRKVLGSTIGELLTLLLKDIFILVVISSIIAWPVSYYIMNKWLQDFAYKISMGIDKFLIPAIITLAIALITVGYQSIKAAIANPVDSLRYE